MNENTNSKLGRFGKKFAVFFVSMAATFVVLVIPFILLIGTITKVDVVAVDELRSSEAADTEELAGLKKEHVELLNSPEYLALAPAKEKAVVQAEQEEKTQADQAEQEKSAVLQNAEATLTGLRSERDEVEGITWYQDSSSPVYVNDTGTYLSLGISDSGQIGLNLHLQYNYEGNWLFISSYTIHADGETYTIDPGYSAISRDNSADGLWEWYSAKVDDSDLLMLRTIQHSDTVIIRMNGDDYYEDLTLTGTEKQAIGNVLDAYYAQLEKNEVEAAG